MNDILSQIAYLDNFSEQPSSIAGLPEELEALVRYIVQLEMAKRGHAPWLAHWPSAHPQGAETVSSRIATLEAHMQWMMQKVESQRARPPVQYVLSSHQKAISPVTVSPSSVKPVVNKSRCPVLLTRDVSGFMQPSS
jgi:hypothetical protein